MRPIRRSWRHQRKYTLPARPWRAGKGSARIGRRCGALPLESCGREGRVPWLGWWSWRGLRRDQMPLGHFLREIVPNPGEVVRFKEGRQLRGCRPNATLCPILSHLANQTLEPAFDVGLTSCAWYGTCALYCGPCLSWSLVALSQNQVTSPSRSPGIAIATVVPRPNLSVPTVSLPPNRSASVLMLVKPRPLSS